MFCWAVQGAPAGKRMAPFLPEIVARLRRFEEQDIDDATADRLCAMSAATIGRRLAEHRAKLQVRGRSDTKPGSLLKDSIPIRTWSQWDDAVPAFVEIDLVGHEGWNASGEHAYTLTLTGRHRHRLDRDPQRAQQGQEVDVRGAGRELSRTSPSAGSSER